MARPVRPWFRVYVEAFADRKLRRLRPEHRWLFIACLGVARQSPEPGALLLAEGQPMDAHDLADYAALDVRVVKSGLKALCASGLLISETSSEYLGDILYRSPAFLSRQFESDDVTKRTRKHRLSREDASEGTFQRRSRERSGNGHGNVPETDTETDTDKDSCASADAEREFAEWYESYPRKRGRGQALKAYRAARKKTDHETLMAAVGAQRGRLMAKGADFCPHPATWLNGERWADEDEDAPAVASPAYVTDPPPDGLSTAEYQAWYRQQIARQRA